MNPPGAPGEGRSTTARVFVFEHVTGGGLAGRDLPASWAAEGSAMRRAIVDDFAALAGVRVVTTLDARLAPDVPPGVDLRPVDGSGGGWFESLAAGADYTALVAPESGGVLAALTLAVERAGGRSIGSGPRAIELVGDKARFARHLEDRRIATPPTRTVEGHDGSLPVEWDGPSVVKPRDGAGSVDTVVVPDRRSPAWVSPDRPAVVQPYLPGDPMSATFLVDREGGSTLLAVARQRVEVDAEGRITYWGGTILPSVVDCPNAVVEAVASVAGDARTPGLRGLVGVDFLLEVGGRAVVLEINPRPTTSIVGLAEVWPRGTIAGAWLASALGPLAGTGWPDRLQATRRAPDVGFDADGTIHRLRAAR